MGRCAVAICLLVVSNLIFVQSNARADGEFLLNVFRFNPVSHPRTVGDVYNECRRDRLCSTALDAAYAYFDIGSGAVHLIDRLASELFPTSSEETKLRIFAYDGYSVCKVSFHLESINPPSGQRSAHFSLQAERSFAQIYAWVPRRGLGGGRGWIDAEVSILMIRSNLYQRAIHDGLCDTMGSDRVHFTCRGARSHHDGAHGWPACPGRAWAQEYCDSCN